MDIKMLPLYFFLGGILVALITYLGSLGKGLLAVFIAFFPSMSLLTFWTIYINGGAKATTNYAKSLIIMTPAWLAYVAAVMLLLPRIGLVPSLLVGVLCYVIVSFLILRLAVG